MSKPLIRLIAIVSLTLFTATTAFAITFNDLTSYQKQKYWQMMGEDKCYDLLVAKKYTAYRTCALNVMTKASLVKESTAWCKNSDPTSDKTPNFLVSGTVTSDLYPQGIKDYIYVSGATSYMMKGFCINDANPRYSYYSKNCAEIGSKYYADANLGVCVNGNHAPLMNTITDKAVNEGTNMQFTVYATDQDNDVLSYEIESLPTGAFFNKNSGLFSFTPAFSTLTAAQKTKVISVKFKAYDGEIWTNWATANITISNVNQAPTISTVTDKTINENNTLSFNLTGTDLDGDTITFAADVLPAGVTLDKKTGAISFTPAYNFIAHPNPVSKVLTFNVQSNDGTASSVFTPVKITVNDKDQAPTITVADQSVTEGSTLSYNLTGSDLDGDTITFSADALPTGVTLNTTTGAISFSPGLDYVTHPAISKVLSFNVKSSDGTFTSSSTPIKITVLDENQSPLINAVPAKSVNEGSNLQFTVAGTDPDSDTLSYDTDAIPAGATFDKTTGKFSYTPEFTTVTTSQNTKVVSVKFKSFDGLVWSAWTQADITVSNVNQAPTISAVTDKTVDEGATLSFNLSGNDPDGDSITYSSADLPTGVTLTPAGAISFSPNYSFVNQPDLSKVITFNVKSSDSTLSSASTAVKITVNNKNQAPLMNAIPAQSVNEGANVQFTVSGTDLDGGSLSYDTESLPAGATFDKTTGKFSYSPDFTTVTTSQKAKVISVKFKSFDGTDWSAWASADITVTNVNLAPTIAAIADQTATEGSTLTVNLSGADIDGDALTYSSADLPIGFTLNASTGVITFSPDYTYISHPNPVSKVLNFNVQSSDGSLSSALVPVKITVNDKNQAPVVTAMDDQYAVAGVDTITFTVKATDPDGDAITGFDYNVGSSPVGLTMSKTTGLVTYTPVPADAQKEFKIPFTATDGSDISAGQVIRVVATNNSTPTFGYQEKTGNPTSVAVGGTITKYFNLINNDPVRFITLKLEAVDFADYTKYINPAWISFPEGIFVTLKPSQTITVKVVMTVPQGATPNAYTMVTRGKLINYGGMKQCGGGICVNVAVGKMTPINITP